MKKSKKIIIAGVACALVVSSTAVLAATTVGHTNYQSSGVFVYTDEDSGDSITIDGNAIGYWLDGTTLLVDANGDSFDINIPGLTEDSIVNVYYHLDDDESVKCTDGTTVENKTWKDIVAKASPSYSQSTDTLTITFKKNPFGTGKAGYITIDRIYVANPNSYEDN